MLQSGLGIIWEPPQTPVTISQPTSTVDQGPPPFVRSQLPWDSIRPPLGESQFYGTIRFGNTPPKRSFNYSAPKKRSRGLGILDENTAPVGNSSPSPSDNLQHPPKGHKPNPGPLQPAATSPKGRMHNTFRTKDSKGNDLNRSPTHSQMMANPDGRIPEFSPNSDLMYSTTVPYTLIRPVRAGLTSFATQIIGKKVAVEAENAVKLSSGLHVSVGKRHPELRLEREDIGEETIPRVEAVFQREQGVTLYLCNNIAMRKPRVHGGVTLTRKARPPKHVPQESPSQSLAAYARDLIFWNFHKVRDLRIGRETVMNVGMSGLYFEAPDINVEVFDLTEKRILIAQDLRKNITVESLLGYLDQTDADYTGTLQVLDVLARCIPSLKFLRSEIAMRLAATAKITAPAGRAIVHPLACSGKKADHSNRIKGWNARFSSADWADATELLKAKASSWRRRLYLCDAFAAAAQHAVWHTKWTDVNRIFQTHWGRTSGKNNQSCLIGRDDDLAFGVVGDICQGLNLVIGPIEPSVGANAKIAIRIDGEKSVEGMI
ncbi:hypothetical protein B0H14DRAFT_3661883 [Mycena olivaceomarginata]|nr:hypothetical protein B0H14DRAFT_3661883 [Mycena olivaceomarginata]